MCKRLIFLVPFVLLLGLVLPSTADAALIAHWTMDDNEPNTTVLDVVGAFSGDFNDPCDPNTSAHAVLGQEAGALDFDGVDDHVDVPELGSDANTNTMTLMAWIKRDGPQIGFMGIYGGRDADDDTCTYFGFDGTGDNQAGYNWDNATWGWASGLVIPDATWTHLSLAVEPTKATMCVNVDGDIGIAENAVAHAVEDFNCVPALPGQLPGMKIAYDTFSEYRHFGGAIDDLRIYDTTLTRAAIRAIANVGLKKPWDPDPANGATGVGIDDDLSWTAGDSATGHMVYCSNDPNDLGSAVDNGASTTYEPGTLELLTTYYWKVLETPTMVEGPVWSFTTVDGKATLDAPADWATGVAPDAALTWTEGAGGPYTHRVYLDTVKADVEDRICGYVDVSGSTSYTHGDLTFAAGYYWTVDEVGAQTWECDEVRKFTVADGIVIDDFEDYADTPALQGVWSELGQGSRYLEPTNAHDSNQSMKILYNNLTGFDFYSAAERTPADVNFNRSDAAALSLWYLGALLNNDDDLYVKLSDSGADSIVSITDANLLSDEWAEVLIDLGDFSVDATDVQAIRVGVGTEVGAGVDAYGNVYFDDIRLYPSRCLLPLSGDLDEDCVVGYGDLDILTQDWLEEEPPPAGGVVNGDFSDGLNGWRLFGGPNDPNDANLVVTIADRDEAGGDGAYFQRFSTCTDSGAGGGIWQLVNVTPGLAYTFNCMWKGDVTDGWAELNLACVDDPVWENDANSFANIDVNDIPSLTHKPSLKCFVSKRSGADPGTDILGPVWDYEPASDAICPAEQHVSHIGSNTIVATTPYMVILFKYGGMTAIDTWMFIDDVTLELADSILSNYDFSRALPEAQPEWLGWSTWGDPNIEVVDGRAKQTVSCTSPPWGGCSGGGGLYQVVKVLPGQDYTLSAEWGGQIPLGWIELIMASVDANAYYDANDYPDSLRVWDDGDPCTRDPNQVLNGYLAVVAKRDGWGLGGDSLFGPDESTVGAIGHVGLGSIFLGTDTITATSPYIVVMTKHGAGDNGWTAIDNIKLVPAGNLLTNGYFEDDDVLGGWKKHGDANTADPNFTCADINDRAYMDMNIPGDPWSGGYGGDLWQVVDVAPGVDYTITAAWQGNLDCSWVELELASVDIESWFDDDPGTLDPNDVHNGYPCVVAKRDGWGLGPTYGLSGVLEPIIEAIQPKGGIFLGTNTITATTPYMVTIVKYGGGNTSWMAIDNVSLTGAAFGPPPPLRGDIYDDGIVDLKDVAVMANEWTDSGMWP